MFGESQAQKIIAQSQNRPQLLRSAFQAVHFISLEVVLKKNKEVKSQLNITIL